MKREIQRKPYPLDPDHDLAQPKLAGLAIAKLAAASDLKRRIVNFLATRNRPGLRQIELEVRDGVVMLRGRVRTFYDKQLAAHCCSRVAGVHQIIDDIQVVAGAEVEGAFALDNASGLALDLNFGQQG